MLEKEFALPMQREERLLTALEMIDSDQSQLGVFEAKTGTDILLQLSRRGCQVFWPSFPDTNLLIQFSDKGNYKGHERWLLSDEPLSLGENRWGISSDGSEIVSIENRVYISNFFGAPRVYTRVEKTDISEIKE